MTPKQRWDEFVWILGQLAQLRRKVWCDWFGHRWKRDNRGEPVVPMRVTCGRCGHFDRLRFNVEDFE